MQLAELYNELIKAPALFEYILGLTINEYTALQAVFNRLRDSTKKLPEPQKLMASLIIRRYSLTAQNIKNIIFANAVPPVTKAVLDKFNENVMERLNQALLQMPALSAKLGSVETAFISSKQAERVFSNLDDFLDCLKQTSVKPSIVTYKSRELSDVWLHRYFQKSVLGKKKTGQDNFLQIMNGLFYDLDQFDARDAHMASYLAAAINFNVHSSSYVPRVGFGKAQQREIERPLFYARSQGKSVFGSMFKAMTSTNGTLQCLLPRNESVYKIVKAEFNNQFTKNLAEYNMHGFRLKKAAESKKNLSYFSLKFAHSGLRHNMYQVTVVGVNAMLQSMSAVDAVKKISTLLHVPAQCQKPIIKLGKAQLKDRVNYLHSALSNLEHSIVGLDYCPDLYEKLTMYRRNHAKAIIAGSSQLKMNNIRVDYDENTTTLDIRFYPGKDIENCENYSLGVTNVIINFFIALLNHNLARHSVFVRAVRRQSFAFNRVSIVETYNMVMRVSLGYEPDAFVGVFVESLRQLNGLLTEFDFLNKKSPKLAKGFEVIEKARSENSDKAGTRFLNVMRSNKKSLYSILTAEALLSKNSQQQKSLSVSFADYIDCLVNVKLDKTENGVSVVAIANLDTLSTNANILVAGLLHNVLKYSLTKIQSIKVLLQQPDMPYSGWVILSKLTKALYKASGWRQVHANYPASHVYAKTLQLVEDILELLVMVEALILKQQNLALDDHARLDALTAAERRYTSSMIEAPEQNITVSFTDNGMQALTVSYLCLNMQHAVENGDQGLKDGVYLLGKCYYELIDNLKDNLGITVCKQPQGARFVFVDVRQIDEFHQSLLSYASAKAVVIDVTHRPILDSLSLRQVINKLYHQGVWVALVGSMLKHEQLGMDKFQAGKIVMIAPPGKKLFKNVCDELRSVSERAMHPLAVSYFQMINMICQDKVPKPVMPLAKVRMFAAQKVSSQPDSRKVVTILP